jgi:hypothetical protein
MDRDALLLIRLVDSHRFCFPGDEDANRRSARYASQPCSAADRCALTIRVLRERSGSPRGEINYAGYLAGIIVVFVVAALYWCVRKSVVVVPDLVMEGEPVTPTPLTLFHRLNGLWSSSSRRGIPCLGATRRSLSSSSTRADARSRLWLCRRTGSAALVVVDYAGRGGD